MRCCIFIISFCFLIYSCARVGSPTGGDKDILAPKLLRAFPDTLSKNVSKDLKEIKLTFNELITITDALKQIIFGIID